MFTLTLTLNIKLYVFLHIIIVDYFWSSFKQRRHVEPDWFTSMPMQSADIRHLILVVGTGIHKDWWMNEKWKKIKKILEKSHPNYDTSVDFALIVHQGALRWTINARSLIIDHWSDFFKYVTLLNRYLINMRQMKLIILLMLKYVIQMNLKFT